MKIPITHSSNIPNDEPDIILILSWNFASSIVKKIKKKYNKKIIYIVPLPEPYYSLMDLSKRYLIIAPHPDDEILGCGGTINKIIKNKGQVAVLTICNHMPPFI